MKTYGLSKKQCFMVNLLQIKYNFGNIYRSLSQLMCKMKIVYTPHLIKLLLSYLDDM